ncbi:MFS general substrate transporter [Daldinia loculata]|uniref:MFS general substrate transporter n=1 Tax=Daldinia loculata TaxID=103429 RepID=UPI0020C420C8|nr:MFS general substrate transporter [Daldinia loculata]KAI1642548.1 MFS general substrate transporter [Daldinia loculata]
MKATRYSTSRQKACQPCSTAKAKCDRKAGCLLDFSSLELFSPIDVDGISNRWLNTYIPIPGQKVKEYPASITAFIYRLLKSYATVAIRGRGVPPFVHPSQISVASTRPPLSTCLSLVRICENPLPGSESVAADVLQREMNNLYEQQGAYDDFTLLAAFQAYLIYSMVLFFKLNQVSGPFLRQAMMNLQELACSSSRNGLMCIAEEQRARPRWEAWIVVEAKRRALFTMYLFDSVLSTQDGLQTFLGTELRGLPASADKSLWRAQIRRDWETAYNIYLADWPEETFRIDELWPIPAGLDEPGLLERRNRVDRWLENVDEFGTMLYAEVLLNTPPASPPPEEPYSIFDKQQKALIVLVVSTAATFSGFASNIYFPALPTIAHDLKISIELVNLTVTSYLIFQGLAPSLWGPISDVKGRKIAYVFTFLVFLGACIGLAVTKSYATLIVLRCLQSTGSASTIAIGSGVIGDITTRAERGGFMGIFQAGLLVPVAVGPVIGGALAGSLGWRSIFVFLAIYSGIFLILLTVLLPETLRSIVANGSRKPSNPIATYPLRIYQKLTKVRWNPEAASSEPAARKHIDVTGPLRILISKHAAPIIIYLAIYYAVWQMSITAMSSLFQDRYDLGETQIGLTFIANGAGSMIGTLVTGKILDTDYRRVKAQYEVQTDSETGDGQIRSTAYIEDHFPLEKARLRLIPVFSLAQCLSIVLFGWTIQYPDRVHIAVPIVSTFITGWTAVSTQSVVMTYLVDIFSDRSAAASASLNLARCLFAAGGTSFIMPMVNGIGVGLAFTICAIVQVVALSGVAIQWKFAASWRQKKDETR